MDLHYHIIPTVEIQSKYQKLHLFTYYTVYAVNFGDVTLVKATVASLCNERFGQSIQYES